MYSTNQTQKLKHKRFDDGLPLIKVKGINGRRWAWKSKRSPTSYCCGGFESPTTTSNSSSSRRRSKGGHGCGDFHRLSWTVSSTVHMALTVLLAGHHVPRAPPFLAVCPPATPWLWIHGTSSPIPRLKHWHNNMFISSSSGSAQFKYFNAIAKNNTLLTLIESNKLYRILGVCTVH